MGGRAAATLVRAIVESERIPETAVEVSSCKLLAMAWCEEIYEPTEWDEFFDFSRWLENVANMSWDRGEEEQLREAFESWLDAELDAILDNAKDLDEADSWATEVRRVTHEYFGMSDFDTRFSRFDTDADENSASPIHPSLRPTNGTAPPMQSSSRRRAARLHERSKGLRRRHPPATKKPTKSAHCSNN